MLKMADVGPDDVVFDLGCGDGRIVIEAARQRGARGVGVDLDPRRVKESAEGKERAGIGDSVRFVNQDLFESDIHDATVVMLFLFPDVNLRLRSKLLKDLRPGARVVSYCHNMEHWLPDRLARVRTNHLYYWVIPGNMSGTWEGTAETEGGPIPLRLDLRQEFQKVSGTVTIGDDVLCVKDAVMRGREISAVARGNPKGNGMDVFLDGVVHMDDLDGRARTLDRPLVARTWTARRDPSTKTDLSP